MPAKPPSPVPRPPGARPPARRPVRARAAALPTGSETAAESPAQPSRERLSQLIHLVAKAWRQQLDLRLRPLGLTRSKWLALISISRGGGISQRNLAALMEIGEPAVVALLDRLEADALIARKPVPGDRRARALELTAAGRRLISRIEVVARELREELLDGFSNQELAATDRVLSRIKNRIEALP